MRLYDVPDGTKVRLLEDAKVPPGAPTVQRGTVLFFCHIDGMYSYCQDTDGNVFHIVAWSNVEEVR